MTEVTAFSVRVSGNLTSSETVYDRGFCYSSTETEPTIENDYVADIDPMGGEYSLKIIRLEPSTKYNVRAYAETKSGFVYGETKEVTTSEVVAEHKSNSYLVTPGTTVTIPVARANESKLGGQIGASDNLTAELVWMDNVGVVDAVETYGTGADGNVVVYAGTTEGNAVVAVKVGDEIKWSWHIWVSQNAGNIGTVELPSGAKLMDRNLGATSTTVSNIGAVGVQFQFGRKDPFTASASFGNPSEVLLFDLEGNNPEIALEENPTTLTFATAHPHTFIKSQWADWSTETVNDWWKSEDGSKTVYDPCPEGWRVPALEAYAGWSAKEGENYAYFDTTLEGGHMFTYNGQSNFFPYTGYREVGGTMDATANFGNLWVNAPIDGNAGIGSALSPSYGVGGVTDVNGAPRGRALSIRCVKE